MLAIMKENSPEWYYILLGSLCSIVTGAGLPVYSIVFGDILEVLSSTDDDYVNNSTLQYVLSFLIIGIVVAVATFFQVIQKYIKTKNVNTRLLVICVVC